MVHKYRETLTYMSGGIISLHNYEEQRAYRYLYIEKTEMIIDQHAFG